jgi:DNA mismatch repair protein MutS2
MQPLFRLETGKPVSSFAFEIARKIGLSEEILAEAADKAGHQHIDFEKRLREIERDKRYWERKRDDVRRHEKRLDEISARQLTELEKIEKERKSIIENARREAQQILASANRIIENTIRTIKESQAEKTTTKEARRELEIFKEHTVEQQNEEEEHILRKIAQLKEREKRRTEKQRQQQSAEKPETGVKPADSVIRKGDTVRLDGKDTIGEVMEINGKNITVAFGNLSSAISAERLEKVSKNECKKQHAHSAATIHVYNVGERRLRFKSNIDVRGMRTDEAIPKVEELVDGASMFNIGEVRILHGKGDGILRQMIRQYLRTSPIVKSFNDEDIQQGGTGITIVKIR